MMGRINSSTIWAQSVKAHTKAKLLCLGVNCICAKSYITMADESNGGCE